jgi:multiple sugar transport system substrate-binding protein
MAAVFLGACRGPAAVPLATPGAGGTAAGASAHPAAVTFMLWGDPAELQAYQDLVAAYEARYPGAAVELTHIPSEPDYRKRLALDYAAGTPPDVVLLNYRRYGGFVARGLLEPLGPYLAQSQTLTLSDFYRQALLPFYVGRQLMCIPQNISSLAVYYNKALFDQAGLAYPDGSWDWNAFLATAQALTRDTDGDGRTDIYGLGLEPTLARLAPFLWQNQGQLVDNLFWPRRLEIDQPPALQAVQWFVDLQVAHHVVPDAEAEASEPSEDRFMHGRLALYLNSRRGVATYREISAFDWDVAPLPTNRGRRTNLLHSDAFCMSAAAPNKPAVWRFIEFANSPEGQTLLARSGRTVPSLIAVAESPAFLNPDVEPAHNQVFLDAILNVRPMPLQENWVDIEAITSDELERAFYGQVSVAEAMRAAVVRTEEYFKFQKSN